MTPAQRAAEAAAEAKRIDREADLIVRTVLAIGRSRLTAMMEQDLDRLQKARAAEADLVAEVISRGGIVPNNHWHERYRLEQRIRAERTILEEILKEGP